jgi:hypothetical protein
MRAHVVGHGDISRPGHDGQCAHMHADTHSPSARAHTRTHVCADPLSHFVSAPLARLVLLSLPSDPPQPPQPSPDTRISPAQVVFEDTGRAGGIALRCIGLEQWVGGRGGRSGISVRGSRFRAWWWGGGCQRMGAEREGEDRGRRQPERDHRERDRKTTHKHTHTRTHTHTHSLSLSLSHTHMRQLARHTCICSQLEKAADKVRLCVCVCVCVCGKSVSTMMCASRAPREGRREDTRIPCEERRRCDSLVHVCLRCYLRAQLCLR